MIAYVYESYRDDVPVSCKLSLFPSRSLTAQLTAPINTSNATKQWQSEYLLHNYARQCSFQPRTADTYLIMTPLGEQQNLFGARFLLRSVGPSGPTAVTASRCTAAATVTAAAAAAAMVMIRPCTVAVTSG